MTKRMLIDATHAEETRVVVLDGNRLEDYDVETATKKQLKGNIYLAKVVRVEPSLQAAFVEYGGNRHGFLAFAEIHPDYYQIPVADRQKLLAMQEAEARAFAEAEEAEALAAPEPDAPGPYLSESDAATNGIESLDAVINGAALANGAEPPTDQPAETFENPEALSESAAESFDAATSQALSPGEAESDAESPPAEGLAADGQRDDVAGEFEAQPQPEIAEAVPNDIDPFIDSPPPETVGGEGETTEELRPPRIPSSFLRQYKIQEVIHRRQILLVQVVKEERGAKGAALTTYISLAGRYCVLMPNSPRGGGISRKITAPADRRRLKEISAELAIPSGMGLIVRTAGANRPKPEIRRDCEYLLRLWDEIRDSVMKSVAPALIYEEASLIKRAIRDVYSRDVEELLVDGDQGWHAARDFMRTLMPTHARKVQLWKDPAGRSLFAHERVEAELDRILSPTVPLRSGGSLVINQAEALVAIDVNSGRATRERNIEETALRTNLEAAEEAARQLRLRDLAGLIVIDFIDMEVRKHNAMVERRLKEALKNDRARVQVGHISHFGLLEMSRQRLRPSLTETSFSPCPHCGGTGHVRSVESAAIHLLRMLEDEASHRGGELRAHAVSAIALYILNHKRAWLTEVEARHGVSVSFVVDDALPATAMRVERIRTLPVEAPAVQPAAPQAMPPQPISGAEEPATLAAPAAEVEQPAIDAAGAPTETNEDAEEGERRRRRRRRRRRHRDEPMPHGAEAAPPEQAEQPDLPDEPDSGAERLPEEAPYAAQPNAQRGRGRRGPRRGSRSGETRREGGRASNEGARSPNAERPPAGGASAVAATEISPYPAGPTPANPFADAAFDLFDAIEAAAEQAQPAPRLPEAAISQSPQPQPSMSEQAEPELAVPQPAALPMPAEPQPAVPQPAMHEPHPVTPPAAEVEAPGVAEAAAPGATDEVADAAPPVDDRPPVAAVKPIVLGTEEAVQVEKKRGWWRR